MKIPRNFAANAAAGVERRRKSTSGDNAKIATKRKSETKSEATGDNTENLPHAHNNCKHRPRTHGAAMS
ncbi:hypothetical protein Y032_0141g2254 [Ancylostoma ceylanicum]|uniref:Uncharacterized protein n=1 Tax=Ancylostoma ceylanicum TaxID=53326 RepID=A0A016T453_9BILA|nr:hypothetical protein Y032_0141g2254 [Ancylostoma ceylanicum]